DGKADEGYLVRYSASNRAYRVYNMANKRVEETMNLRFLEEKANIQGIGHKWQDDDSDSNSNEQVILVPSYPSNNIPRAESKDTSDAHSNGVNTAEDIFQQELARLKDQEQRATSDVERQKMLRNFGREQFLLVVQLTHSLMMSLQQSDLGNNEPSPGIFSSSSYDDEFGADLDNLASTVEVSPVAMISLKLILFTIYI
ncbi:hypothetical protein Tco_0062782, partial [Tanacetum coccineum]